MRRSANFGKIIFYDAGKIAREQAGMGEEAIKIKEEEREKVKA